MDGGAGNVHRPGTTSFRIFAKAAGAGAKPTAFGSRTLSPALQPCGVSTLSQRVTTHNGNAVIDLGPGNSLTVLGDFPGLLREAYVIFG